MRSTIVIAVLFSFYTFLSFQFIPNAYAEDGSELCPENFPESLVTTAHVDCFRVTSSSFDREAVELLRLQREAECLAEPRSELIRSEIIITNNGRFQASLTCRINFVVPADTILCPDDSIETYRAFNYLACQYFGTASLSRAAATTALNNDVAACQAAQPAGQVLASAVLTSESADDEERFYFSSVACGFEIPAIDVFECPVGYQEQNRSEDLLECERVDEGIPSIDEATALSIQVQDICTTTTAGLGSVVEVETTLDESSGTFRSEVDCDISLPRFGEFVDGDVVRACDASCTEDLEQVRRCVNGNVGDPGCTENDTQILVRGCNTGTLRASACPIMGVPSANIVPLLLLQEEDETEE